MLLAQPAAGLRGLADQKIRECFLALLATQRQG
jgi:hypothetical protein